MTAAPIMLAWSGGKDCLMALQRLRQDPAWEVIGLLTTINRAHQRIAMHGVRRELLHAQAQALALPVWEVMMDWPGGNQDYEQVHAEALWAAARRWPGLRHCAYGDLFLADVRAYREKQLAGLGWQAVFPLWGEDTGQLARHFIASGHRALLCCVDTLQLDARFCGRDFDATLLQDLPPSTDPCGERGEFHTFSHAGPAFAHALPIRPGRAVRRDQRFEFIDITLRPAG